MSNLFVWREQLQNLYSRYSVIVDKVLQFVLAFFTFFFINNNVAFTKAAASPLITLALAVICTFLPTVFTVICGAGLMLVHMYGLSLGVMIITAVIYLVLFIFYFRFTSKNAFIVLLVPLAFFLKVPYVIPIAYGMIGNPICIIPIAFGTIVYYMIDYVKSSATALTAAEDLLEQCIMYVQQILANKELWITLIAFTICIFTVYTIRRLQADHAWSIAIISGAVVNVIVLTAGAIALNVKISYGLLFVGSIISVLIAFVLELFVFAVDYSRSERLQYEDDEYYYYVKAIPKISVAAPEKQVKRINERQPTASFDTGKILEEEMRRGVSSKVQPDKKQPAGKAQRNPNSQPRPTAPKPTGAEDPDAILLEQTLRDELNL